VTDDIIRTAAVVAAAALLAAPYRQQIVERITQAIDAAQAHGPALARIAAAGLIVAAAWGKIPVPTMPSAPSYVVPVVTPSDEMQRLVTPIAVVLKSLPMSDRMLWAATWTKAAVVVAGDAVTTEVVFTDSRSLRGFTVLAIDIAWRRIGQHAPGSTEGLREAVEAAYGQAIGTDEVAVTPELRARYGAFAKAVAWAGVGGG
jgi:hypothetical protein